MLAREVAHSGVLTLEMAELRDLNGSGRLGPHVVAEISKKLAGEGIGHYPEALPQEQWRPVRLFKLGSRIAELYDAALKISEEGDETLREMNSADYVEMISKIRSIVDRPQA